MIHFIHVGKCAGSSVSSALRDLKIPFKEYHCFDADKVLQSVLSESSGDFFLISVRDPVKRFISAFYWDFYEKRVTNNKLGPKNVWLDLYNTFNTPNEVGEALSSTNSKLRTKALTFFHNSSLHAQYSLSWYIKPSNVKYLNPENCSVIRTESADKDFQKFLNQISIDKLSKSLPREKSNYKQHIDGYDTNLSDLAIKNIKNIYCDDYLILDGFYRKGLIEKRYA